MLFITRKIKERLVEKLSLTFLSLMQSLKKKKELKESTSNDLTTLLLSPHNRKLENRKLVLSSIREQGSRNKYLLQITRLLLSPL